MRSNNQEQDLKSLLKAMVEAFKLKPQLTQARIKSLWDSELGFAIARHTQSIRLKNNTLYVSINSSPLKQELSYGKEKIRNILNEALGEEAIKEVVLL